MTKTNYWMAQQDPLIEWKATLPTPTDFADSKKLLNLAQSILEVGEREEVYRVVEMEGSSSMHNSTHDFNSSSGCTYAQYAEKEFVDTGDLLLFFLSYKNFRTLSKVCYYNLAGEIVEGEVDSLGEILKQTRPGLSYSRNYMSEWCAPVMFCGGLGGGSRFFKETDFTVQIYTDIWFPQVVGFLSEGKDDGYDNRELALCHTLRFNRFLSDVRKLVLDYGGTWKIVDQSGRGFIGFYERMVTEGGIILEP